MSHMSVPYVNECAPSTRACRATRNRVHAGHVRAQCMALTMDEYGHATPIANWSKLDAELRAQSSMQCKWWVFSICEKNLL